jgi:hypothetical protein
MAIPKTNLRGLQNIRTYSGRVGQTFLPHRAHMKLACLEMEKVRRGEERKSAMKRVRDINTRFLEIEQEKSALLQRMDKTDSSEPVDAPEEARGPAPRPSRRCCPRSLRLRY